MQGEASRGLIGGGRPGTRRRRRRRWWTRGRARRRTRRDGDAWPRGAGHMARGPGSASRAGASWSFWTARVGVVCVGGSEARATAAAAAWPDHAWRPGARGASISAPRCSVRRSHKPGPLVSFRVVHPCRCRNEFSSCLGLGLGWREDMQNFKFPFWMRCRHTPAYRPLRKRFWMTPISCSCNLPCMTHQSFAEDTVVRRCDIPSVFERHKSLVYLCPANMCSPCSIKKNMCSPFHEQTQLITLAVAV